MDQAHLIADNIAIWNLNTWEQDDEEAYLSLLEGKELLKGIADSPDYDEDLDGDEPINLDEEAHLDEEYKDHDFDDLAFLGEEDDEDYDVHEDHDEHEDYEDHEDYDDHEDFLDEESPEDEESEEDEDEDDEESQEAEEGDSPENDTDVQAME